MNENRVVEWKYGPSIPISKRPLGHDAGASEDLLAGFMFRVPDGFLKNREFMKFVKYDAFGNPWTNAISGDRYLRIYVGTP